MMKNRQLDAFFAYMNRQHLALTYGDIRLMPRYSDCLPAACFPTGRVTRNIQLPVPILSAAMDTVTEWRMAIAMARCGGLGIIHRNLSLDEQMKQVKTVKRYTNGMIIKPVCIKATDRISDVENMIKAEGLKFRSFPVVDDKDRLVGIVTEKNFDFKGQKQFIRQIMTKDIVTAPENTTIKKADVIMRKHGIKRLPIVNSEHSIVGMFVWSDVRRILDGNREGLNLDKQGHLRVGAAIGASDQDLERGLELDRAGVDLVVLDTAHGDTGNVLRILKEAKKRLGCDVLVGNVSTADAARRLARAGADGIKVGQGGGSICTTRIVAGIGIPQATAVYECARALRSTGVPICADGGITSSGDMVIGLALGADCVMIGGMLAGCDEAPGETFTSPDGKRLKLYRGMGSPGAMKNASSRERYGHKTSQKVAPEGVEGAVLVMGPVHDRLMTIVGGIQAGMGYLGAPTLKDLRRNAIPIRMTEAGLSESRPHDLAVISVTSL